MKHWPAKNHLLTITSFLCILVIGAGAVYADSLNPVLSSPITPTSLEGTTTIDQRLVSRKNTYRTQLAGINSVNLAGKCVLAQSAITDVRSKDTKDEADRVQTYSSLVTRLSFLVDNLSAQGVDATSLLAAENQFTGLVNTYMNDAENYKAAIDDSITIDCKSDPIGFMASVLDARKWRTQLGVDASAIKKDQTSLVKALSTERQLLITKNGVKTKANP
ncbi:MAG TPA: hypothetical protein VFP35_00505 [Candidatus Saccharimonadales bacterium]|nr:hypothetical protein [Candidatus Saccharimonadales bacterium]